MNKTYGCYIQIDQIFIIRPYWSFMNINDYVNGKIWLGSNIFKLKNLIKVESKLDSWVNKWRILDTSILSRIKPFKCENKFLSGKLCIDKPILVLLGSNPTELLWFKGGWFHIFLQIRGKWCLLILGVFPNQCWLLNYFISKKYVDILYINWYFINAWFAHWLFVLWKTCGTT